jgi:hypothetical protein
MASVSSITGVDTLISSVHYSIGVKAFSKRVEVGIYLVGCDSVHGFLLSFNTFSISQGEFEA